MIVMIIAVIVVIAVAPAMVVVRPVMIAAPTSVVMECIVAIPLIAIMPMMPVVTVVVISALISKRDIAEIQRQADAGSIGRSCSGREAHSNTNGNHCSLKSLFVHRILLSGV